MNKYNFKRKLGIDDLFCEFAFVGNSQGDTSGTNALDVYLISDGWLSFVFNCELNHEEINKESQKRKQANK